MSNEKKSPIYILWLLRACSRSAYVCPQPFWQSVLINTSTSFLALGIGLIFVNIYLERNSRKDAVRSLLILSDQAIATYHNTWLDLCWAKFGRDRFSEITVEYIKSNGAPEGLQRVVRDLYTLVKDNAVLISKLESLENALTELSRMAGWDLDARLLKACLDARISISRLREITMLDISMLGVSANPFVVLTLRRVMLVKSGVGFRC